MVKALARSSFWIFDVDLIAWISFLLWRTTGRWLSHSVQYTNYCTKRTHGIMPYVCYGKQAQHVPSTLTYVDPDRNVTCARLRESQ